MPLSWNEIRLRATNFVEVWSDKAPKAREEADAQDIEAAEHMGELHDALKENGYSGHELEIYLVRLLFCLFADDSGIFDEKKIVF